MSTASGDDDNDENAIVDSQTSGTLGSDESDSEAMVTLKNTSEQPVSSADVDRELLRYDYENFELLPDEEVEPIKPVKKPIISLERGKLGVFDVEELVDLLHDENGRDICVIHVPKEFDYVDFMVLVTGRSTRHLRAMAEYIKWTYKKKRFETDPESVKIEGELTNDWFAIDLGNIAVHLFLRNTRRLYDLETLWTVGVEHDEKSRLELANVHQAVMQRDEFSFDAELERLRRLRDSATSGGTGDVGDEVLLKKNLKSMENRANWHDLNNR